VPNVLKSGSVNLLQPTGPVQACNGIAYVMMQYKLCLLCGLPYDLQMTYKIYIKIHENPWIGNVLACDLCPGCVQKRQIWVDTFQHFERPSALVLKRKLIVLSGPGYLILSTAVVNLRFV